jgi:hypothetical protein
LILASLLFAAFVINVDTTIVNVALPTLIRELHASTSQLQWIVDAYNLVSRRLSSPPGASLTGWGARVCCSRGTVEGADVAVFSDPESRLVGLLNEKRGLV